MTMWSVDDIRLSKRKDIVIHSDPVLHFSVPKFLPADFYNALVDALPTPAEFPRRMLEGKMYFDKPRLREELSRRPAWKAFVDAMTSQEFMDDVYDLVRPGLVQARGWFGARRWRRVGEEPASLLSWTIPIRPSYEFSLMEHDAYLTPHTDKMSKYLSLLLYIPPKNWKPEYGGGTDLYRPLEPHWANNWMNRHLPFDKVKTVYTSPYEPNVLFGFVKSADSWHGVAPLSAPADIYRSSFNVNYSLPGSVQKSLPYRALASLRRRLEARHFTDVPDMKAEYLAERRQQVAELAEAGLDDATIARQTGLDVESVRRYRA
jgi:hypothetical protein